MSFRHGGILLGAGEGKTISVLGDSYTYKAGKEKNLKFSPTRTTPSTPERSAGK
jgi:predicted GNAT superfamily acetyltransferase